jgi:uncharacterized protein (DUF2141 family)
MTFWTTLKAGRAATLLSASVMAATGAGAQVPCRGEPSATRLHVVVEGVRDARGLMAATLYGDDPDKFLKSKGELRVWFDPAEAPTMEMCVYLPGPGLYGMALYHDANANHHFDRALFGPTEGYGFSRNPHLLFGPPPLRAVSFHASDGETTVHVRMRYP